MSEETKAKKPKPPKLEDKPFSEFIQEHFNPTLKEALAKEGVADLELDFTKQSIPIPSYNSAEKCWQIIGNWQQKDRQFNLYFPDEDIKGQKAFSCSTNGNKPSTLESFMIDERKITLDLLVLFTIQRLKAQKWLIGN